MEVMAICPTCSHNSDDDFGLVTCSSCGAQFMVGIDGTPTPLENKEAAESPKYDDVPPLPQDVEQVEVAAEFEPIAQAEPIMSSPIESELFVPPLPEDIAPRAVVETSFKTEREMPRPAATSDMREIADFGNSDMSTGREGFLRFNIYVTGIDSSDVRTEVREILADSKFRWNVDQLIASIRNGELRLLEVPAVKSALVVQRLRGLPVEVRWEQYSITQS